MIIFGSEFGLADLSILKNQQIACMPFWRHTGAYAFHINHKHLETRTTFFAHNDFAMIGRGSCNYIHFKLKQTKKKKILSDLVMLLSNVSIFIIWCLFWQLSGEYFMWSEDTCMIQQTTCTQGLYFKSQFHLRNC